MIKNGKYAYYKGNEYKFSRDADGNYIIITSDLKKTDCTFKDMKFTKLQLMER